MTCRVDRLTIADRGRDMSGKIMLKVIEGPMKGEVFTFEEHETFIFGRDPDCHASLSHDDRTASRHHFVLEVNPPDARIRDLGSLNGTYVNGTKYGGRDHRQSPEEAMRQRHPEVDIKGGDRISVGDTVFEVVVNCPVYCANCGTEIPDAFLSVCRREGNAYLCPQCQDKAATLLAQPSGTNQVTCRQCGKDASAEVGERPRGDYICEACRRGLESNPIEAVADALLQKYKNVGPHRAGPAAIPGYEVGRMLGQGGMGSVYVGKRKLDGETVAIKVMLSRIAVSPRSRELFSREIEVTKNLRHPNMVELYEHGSAGAAFYFVMEYCGGGNVGDLRVKRGGKLSVEETYPLMLGALEGLSFAHSHGYVHRDIKPQNILITGRNLEKAKIADLGLAKNFEKAGFSGMTVTGATAGSPLFMPREQVINFKYVKPASDVWSMAATFYSILVGFSPYDIHQGDVPLEVVLRGKLIPIRERDPAIPKQLGKVIDKALALDYDKRYPSAGELLDALRKAF